MQGKIVCRVCTTDGIGEGIWYDKFGNQKNNGLPSFQFYHAPTFPMPYSKEHADFISVANNIQELFFWFTPEDIKQLEPMGYYITLFEAEKLKEYEFEPGKFHIVAEKKSMKRLGTVKIEDYVKSVEKK